MVHVSRLTAQVRSLLQAQRVAALGTIGADGGVLVSMVPFAIEPQQRCLVIHVSELAAHTRNLQATPRVSLMVMQCEVAGEPVHALPRVTFDGTAMVPEGHASPGRIAPQPPWPSATNPAAHASAGTPACWQRPSARKSSPGAHCMSSGSPAG